MIKREAVIILLTLIILYVLVQFISPSITGNVVIDSSLIQDSAPHENAIYDFASNVSLELIENRTVYWYSSYNISSITKAEEDGENFLDDVNSEDDDLFKLKKKDKLFIEFGDELEKGDVIVIKSDQSSDKDVNLCDVNGCNLSNVEFYSNSKEYNLTINGNYNNVSLDSEKNLNIDHIYLLKNNSFSYELVDYYYPAKTNLIYEKDLPLLTKVHNLILDENLNNQSIEYYYSFDNESWNEFNSSLNEYATEILVKARLNSDGNNTPVINSLKLNTSRCISDCFPKKYDVNGTKKVSVMANSSVLVNSTFTILNISTNDVYLDKEVFVEEYSNHNVSNNKKQLNKFVDVETEINGTFELVMYYEQEYVDSNNLDESSIKIHYFNESSDKWEAIESFVDAENNKVTATLDHLSTYGLFGDENSVQNNPPSGSSGSSPSKFIEVIEEKPIVAENEETKEIIVESEEEIVIENEIEQPMIQEEENIFRGITGGVISLGKKAFRFSNIILPSLLILSAIAYVFIRHKRAKNRKYR